MTRVNDRRFSPTQIMAAVGIVVLITVVVALVVSALQVGETSREPGERGANELLLTPPPETEPPAPPPPPPVTPSSNLMTVANDPDAGTQLVWRVTAGECVVGNAEPSDVLVERSEDLGDWEDVTPNLEIREVVFIEALSSVIVEAVVLQGAECEPQVIRSFTAGNFWETYDDSLAGAIYVAANRNEIVTPAELLAAPCEPAFSTSGQSVELRANVCENALHWWQDEAWVSQELVGLHSAAIDGETATAATVSLHREGCEGSLLQRWSGPDALLEETCLAGVADATVFALPSEAIVWHSGGVEMIAL